MAKRGIKDQHVQNEVVEFGGDNASVGKMCLQMEN